MSAVNEAVNAISNGMLFSGAALLLIVIIGLLLTRMEDEEGGWKHDDTDH